MLLYRSSSSSTHAPNTNTNSPVLKYQKDGNELTLTKLLTDIHTPDNLYTDSTERAKVELQRYLTDIITDHFDPNGYLDPL